MLYEVITSSSSEFTAPTPVAKRGRKANARADEPSTSASLPTVSEESTSSTVPKLDISARSSEVDETPPSRAVSVAGSVKGDGTAKKKKKKKPNKALTPQQIADRQRGMELLAKSDRAVEQVKKLLNLEELTSGPLLRPADIPEDTRDLIPWEPERIVELQKTQVGKSYKCFMNYIRNKKKEEFTHYFAFDPQTIVDHNIAERRNNFV